MPVNQPGLANVFSELGASIGTDIMPDENGVVTLNVGDDVALSVEVPDDSEFVYFHSPVRRLGAGNRMGELEAALRQNLFRLPLSGAWLALDQSTDELLLCYSVPCEDLTADQLANIIEALSDAVREVRAEAKTSQDGAADGEGHLSAGDDFIRV